MNEQHHASQDAANITDTASQKLDYFIPLLFLTLKLQANL